MSVSSDTVLPCELGASPLSKVVICEVSGTPPLPRAVDRADSNETPLEWKPGVFTLAMLLARASPRWASPSRANCVACIVRSAIPSKLLPPLRASLCGLRRKQRRGKKPGLLPSSFVVRGSVVVNRGRRPPGGLNGSGDGFRLLAVSCGWEQSRRHGIERVGSFP